MDAKPNHETSLGTRTILYTDRTGRRVSREFHPSELERCSFCNKFQPTEYMAYHSSFEHGINPESGKLNAPAAPHYNVPIPPKWALERM